MTCKDYEAKVMYAKLHGETMVELNDIIVGCLKAYKREMKREELIHMVACSSGIDKHDLSRSINNNLHRLEQDGLIRMGSKTGYWLAC